MSDLPLSWERRNGLFADDAIFSASAITLTDVQLQLQRDLESTTIWTKEHSNPLGKNEIHDHWYEKYTVSL